MLATKESSFGSKEKIRRLKKKRGKHIIDTHKRIKLSYVPTSKPPLVLNERPDDSAKQIVSLFFSLSHVFLNCLENAFSFATHVAGLIDRRSAWYLGKRM